MGYVRVYGSGLEHTIPSSHDHTRFIRHHNCLHHNKHFQLSPIATITHHHTQHISHHPVPRPIYSIPYL
ncbi:hypothetical protein EON63_15035 [archaeon]|nr:MAG: hypothetical protein EON63_15035 [archaeon]